MNQCACGCGSTTVSKKARFCVGHNMRGASAPNRVTPPPNWTPPNGLCECGCGQPTPIAKSTKRMYGHYAGYPIRFLPGHNSRGKRAWNRATPDIIPDGFCRCGCGQQTSISNYTRRRTDHFIGLPAPYVTGHNRNTRGGGYVDGQGYRHILVPEHPHANKQGYVREHRLVMERIVGRFLEPYERVHHKNGIRDDNREENLELWKLRRKDPSGVRATDYHCAGCRCFA